MWIASGWYALAVAGLMTYDAWCVWSEPCGYPWGWEGGGWQYICPGNYLFIVLRAIPAHVIYGFAATFRRPVLSIICAGCFLAIGLWTETLVTRYQADGTSFCHLAKPPTPPGCSPKDLSPS